MKRQIVLTRKKIILAISISLFVTLANYIVGNTSIPLPGEMTVLRGWEQLKSLNGWSHDSIPDDVLLVDVAYDKQLVDYYKDEILVGQRTITDRQKLLTLLTAAKKADNYKYIMLDVIFEEGIKSPQDSALFHLIASMDRIVIAAHKDTQLQDSCLYSKAANADYTITSEETNFARYQFIHDGQKSIPLHMYEDMNQGQIKKWWFLYFDHGWICRNGLTLKMPVRFADNPSEGEMHQNYDRQYLGADILSIDSVMPISEQIKDKIVVVGDFKEDTHDTYLGVQPGSVICLNAYYALLNHDHIILGHFGATLLFYLLMCFVYFALTIAILNGFTLSSITKKIWLKIILSLFSISTFFWIIAVFAYITPLDIAYNIWIPLGVFSILDLFFNYKKRYNNIKNEKEENNDSAASANDSDNNNSSTLQDTIPELPQNTD